MDKNQKKIEDKKIDRATATQKAITGRGDLSKSLLNKVFQDLDIIDILQDHDRGDSRVTNRQCRNYIAIKPYPLYKPRKSVVVMSKTDEVAARILSAAKKEILNDFDANNASRKESASHSAKIERRNVEEKAKKASKATSDEINDCRVKVSGFKKNFDDVAKANNPLSFRATDKFKSQNKNFLDLEARRRIREKYTVKLKSNQICKNVENTKGSLLNDDSDANKKQSENNTDSSKPYSHGQSKSLIQTEPKKSKWSKETSQLQKKPIVRTVRLSNDNRVYEDYKTITFLKEKGSTPLQIKIPTNCKKDTNSVETNTVVSTLNAVESHVSVQMRKIKKRRDLKKKSPLITSKYGPPQTEVAKWAPSSITQHTKPYYEAWVDTTLTSTVKCSGEEQQRLKKENFLRTFKRALEIQNEEQSPDLIYEQLNDDRFTGKITVRRSNGK